MTVNTTNITSGPYAGNDVADTFSYTFRVTDKSELTVYETNDSGVETILTVDTDYFVSGIGSDVGGTIVRNTGPLPTGYTWFIRSNYNETQLTAFTSQGAFFPDLHESAIDKNVFLIQQLRDSINRSIRVSDTDTTFNDGQLRLPDVRENSFLKFDDNKNIIAVPASDASAPTINIIEESSVLSDGQLIVTFNTIDCRTAAFYVCSDNVDNGRLCNTEYSIVDANNIMLTNSYPGGTVLIAVVNEPSADVKFSKEVPLTFDTVSAAQLSIKLTIGYTLLIKERASALFDVVDSTTVTPNGFDVIASTALPSLAFVLRESASDAIKLKPLGAVADGVADDTAVFMYARDKLATNPKRGLIFEAGTYTYSVSPNWAIQDATITTDGEVIFNYTGTGKAVIIDARQPDAVTVVANQVYNVRMGRIMVDAPATATDGVYWESTHHCYFDFLFLGGCNAGTAFNLGFAVVSEFRLEASVNRGGWSTGGKPNVGLKLREFISGELPSYCTFYNPIFEGCDVGIQGLQSLGNTFVGGTSEACLDSGLIFGTGCIYNKVLGMDFEANVNFDILDTGTENSYVNVDSLSLSVFGTGAKNCKLQGGSFHSIRVDGGATNCQLSDVTYNRVNTGGTLVVNDDSTRMSNMYNAGTKLHHDAIPSTFTIAVGVSPFTYTNPFNNNISVSIIGGTGVFIAFIRNGSTYGINVSEGEFLLSPKDSIILTYTTAPVLRVNKG